MNIKGVARIGIALFLLVFAPGIQAADSLPKADVDAALKAAHAKYKDIKEGKNADYIPALAKVDPKIYGIALVTTDGQVYTAGDIKSEVSIQSISKVFTMAKVIEEQGPDAIANNMGVDATGQAFNSIVAVEQYKGAEMNPLVNPGAITATSMVSGGLTRGHLEEHHRLLQRVRRPAAFREPRSLQVGGRHESTQPGDREAHVRVRPHQG
jgi:glutaminase